MRKWWMKTVLLLMMVSALFSCFAMEPARAAGLEVFSYMKTYTEGENLEILWYAVDGADHYDCTIKCGSTYLRNRSRTDSYYACYLDGSRVTAGSYKVWVGAIDADGNTIADNIIYFTVNEKDECEHCWDEDTGCCSWCDQECPHNNGYYEVEYDSIGKSISSTKHEITETYRQECKICRYVVKKGLKRTTTGKHSFDSNGDCKLCDYRAACTHSEKELVPHEPTYTQYNETYHKKKVISDLVCANANCGKVIAYGDDVKTTTQKHTMIDDRCKYCGYTVEYENVEVTLSRDNSTGYIGQSIGATASAKGGTGNYSYAWYVYCDGAEVYSTTSWDKRGTYSPAKAGTYTFKVYVTDRNNGDSASATSGSITVTAAPCSHTKTSEVYKAGADTYIKLSDSKHTVEQYYDVVCNDCGKVINTFKRSSSQDHTYSGSNCTRCGSAKPETPCAHPSMSSSEMKRTPRKTESDAYHYVDIIWKDVCASCKITLNTTRKTTEREDHTYVGNTCSSCGYIRIVKCDHADKKRESLGSTTVKADDQRHVVTTAYRVTCASCGDVLNSRLEEEAYFAHTFENGQCRYCDAVEVVSEPVTPAPVTPAPVTPAPENVVCKVHGAAHVLDYTGYEAAHPHKVFRRCDCGYASYTGENRPVATCHTCFPVTPTPEPTVVPQLPMPMGPQYVEQKDPYQDALKEFGKASENSDTEAGDAINRLTGWYTNDMFEESMDIAYQNASNGVTAYFKALYRTGTDLIGTVEGIIDNSTNDVADRETQQFLVDLLKNMLAEKPSNFSESDAHDVMMKTTEVVNMLDSFNDNVIYSDETITALVDSLAVADPKQQELIFSWVSSRPDYKKLQVSGGAMDFAGDAASFLLDGVDIYLEHKEEYAHLLALTVQYEENMKLLDDIIAVSGENSSLGRACLTVQGEMTDALNDVYGVSDSSKIRLADSAVRTGVSAMGTALGSSPAGGVVNAVLLAGDIGSMITPNTAARADLEDELVMLLLIDGHMDHVARQAVGTDSAYAVMSLYVDYLRYGTEVGLAYEQAYNGTVTGTIKNFFTGRNKEIKGIESDFKVDIDALNRIDQELQDAFEDIYASQKYEVDANAINPATRLPYGWEAYLPTNQAPQATKEPAAPSKTYVVTTDRAILRFGPEINSEYALTVNAGTRLEYLGTAGSWYKVLDPQGRTVYVTMSKAVLE